MSDRKDTKNKHNPLLMPIEADKAFSAISDYGLRKYENRYSWMDNDPLEGMTKYLSACVRHAKAHAQEGITDRESGLPHVYAALWNAAVACWHYERWTEEVLKER